MIISRIQLYDCLILKKEQRINKISNTSCIQAVLNLFGKAKVNVNLLLHFLNAKFYGK